MRRLLVILLAGTLVLGLIGAGLFIYVDAQVKRRLQFRESHAAPVVYSDVFTIAPGVKLSPVVVLNQLSSRRYRQVDAEQTSPGEFRWDERVFTINARDFIAADGSHVPSYLFRYTPSSGEVENLTAQARRTVVLEPQVISFLGSSEQRVSSYTPLTRIPDNLIKAVVAIEDERFVKHFGIDLIGISRAMLRNIKAMAIVEGGSTITQQLAKNLLFSPRRTLGRKIMEAFAALSLELRLSKDRILELYLNEVYLGQEGSIAIHGVSEAAQSFFGKQLSDLSVAETAMLAGLIKAPSAYSPRRHYKRALARSQLVLQKMRDLNLVSDSDFKTASAAKPQVIKTALHSKTAPHYVNAVTAELDNYFSVEATSNAGLAVFTGLDPALQRCAEQTLEEHGNKIEADYPRLRKKKERVELGLVAIEPYSGKIRAWAGSRDYGVNQFDHVAQAKRQIGSTIKAFLYLTALDRNLNSYKVATPVTILSDEPLQIDLVTRNSWAPENFDHKYRGDVTVRYALENSLNIPAAYVGQKVGISNFARTLRSVGIGPDFDEVPALALGAADTSLLKLTAAYAALANGGLYAKPRSFVSALDGDLNTLARTTISETRIADESAVYVLTNMLQGVLERGTGRAARNAGFTAPAAGKTGTSNEARDAWFVGFTPNLAVGVWAGFDDNSPLGLTGGAVAAPAWGKFMKCSSPYLEELNFIPPPGVAFVDIDATSGQRAGADCPPERVVKEVFVRGTEPQRYCEVHGGYIDEQPPQFDLEAAPLPRRRKRDFWDTIFGLG